MDGFMDGPCSPLFYSLRFNGNMQIGDLPCTSVSEAMKEASVQAPTGQCVAWGIPFHIDKVILIDRELVIIEITPVRARWIVFMHASDVMPLETNRSGFISPMRGEGRIGEHIADYRILYADGTKVETPVLRRHQIGSFQRRWGENCVQAVPHRKPQPWRSEGEHPTADWGRSQRRVMAADKSPWLYWLWAWENPNPAKAILGFEFMPLSGAIIISAISAGDASSSPLRWRTRRKMVLQLDEEKTTSSTQGEKGTQRRIQLDLGQVISASPRPFYPESSWPHTYNNQIPRISENEILIDYTSHVDARFHLAENRMIPVLDVERNLNLAQLKPIAQEEKRVKLRVVERGSGKSVPVKIHVHGEEGEYLPPIDRHRIINPAWFEDYSVDFLHLNVHPCTYIHGETMLHLPMGKVYIEVSKGFDIKPTRQIHHVKGDTDEIVIEIDRTLNWRGRGWVSADTHVHFLSPSSALLEGTAEGVNVVNLLASQWGELKTNVGDFDGRTTWGSQETGGGGEYLVRVGTENRQHVMGHISLLGYSSPIITPLTTGGPDESALGDPVEILLMEWARKCKEQGGLTVLPHFPDPRLENAACIVEGVIDAVEMTSWGDLYGGIDPYSLSDWYRFLNCGYLVAAVGGTDKMNAATPIGAVRTYARTDPENPFTYEAWMRAVQRGETFVTYGPLLEFWVEGKPMGSRVHLPPGGGKVEVTWQAASVTVPMSRVELIVNGEIRESTTVPQGEGYGYWSVGIDESCWLALLVRGHYPDKPEIIAAHSSPVMITIEDSPLLVKADGVTILEQIEGALAYVDTIGTRADDVAYKRMRAELISAYRALHNRMHEHGYYHESPLMDRMTGHP